MNSFKFISVLALIFPMLVHAETVTTTDGRTITLNPDGTYVIDPGPTSEVDAYLTLREPFFERHVSQYCLTSAPMGHFKHLAERRVSGSS